MFLELKPLWSPEPKAVEWLRGWGAGGGCMLVLSSPGPRPHPYAEKHSRNQRQIGLEGARQRVFWSPREASVFKDL